MFFFFKMQMEQLVAVKNKCVLTDKSGSKQRMKHK